MSNPIQPANVSNIKSFPLQRLSIILSIILGVALLTLTGCGQKGELYLTAASSQNASQTIVTETASDALNSTSQPQDAAFATIDDDGYEKSRYLEEKRVMPAVSDDPNDY